MWLPWNKVLFVIVCCVLKVFKKIMWKRKNSYLTIPLPQRLLNFVAILCFEAVPPREGLCLVAPEVPSAGLNEQDFQTCQ